MIPTRGQLAYAARKRLHRLTEKLLCPICRRRISISSRERDQADVCLRSKGSRAADHPDVGFRGHFGTRCEGRVCALAGCAAVARLTMIDVIRRHRRARRKE